MDQEIYEIYEDQLYEIQDIETMINFLDDTIDMESELENFKTKLENEYSIDDVDICYTGFWSQGDGLSYTGKFKDLVKLFDKFSIKISDVVKDNINDIEIWVDRGNSNYSHENTCFVNSYIYYDDDDSDVYKEIEKAVDSLVDALEKDRIEQCKDLYRELTKYYENYVSEERALMLLQELKKNKGDKK